MIKRLILKACDLTGLAPYDVMEGFVSGFITALLLLVSVYPTFYTIAAIGKLLGF